MESFLSGLLVEEIVEVDDGCLGFELECYGLGLDGEVFLADFAAAAGVDEQVEGDDFG